MESGKNRVMSVTPANLDLTQIMAHFATDEAAREYLEAVRWPNGPVCPHCSNADQAKIYAIAANPAKKVRAGLYECKACNGQFTVTVGTIFEDSKIPLRKWLVAWYMLCTSKKGVSALQIQRMLDIGSYRTAWFMMHRIRYALRDPVFADKLGGGGGIVEVDETYVGGKPRRGSGKQKNEKGRYRVGRGTKKIPVVALVERDGRARSYRISGVGKNLKQAIRQNVDRDTHIMTDELLAYRGLAKEFAGHHVVKHSAGEYARGNAHTNTVEGFFALFKRGVNGTFHHIGTQYMDQYLAEFDFRYNHRKVTDGERTIAGLKKVEGKRLMLRQPAARS
jgi:transposase-like protein